MENIAYTIQTCDGGSHRRKDRVNGGMYITDGLVSMALSTMQPQETVIIQRIKRRISSHLISKLKNDTIPTTKLENDKWDK